MEPITCMFCKKFATRATSGKGLKNPDLCHNDVTTDTKVCGNAIIDGTFVCPITHKYQHIGSCIRRVEKKNNRSAICNKRCAIYQMREIILFWMNPPKTTKLKRR